MRRKKPLRRSTKPIPKRRKDPKRRAFAKHRCKPFTDWLKTLPCHLTGRRTGQYVQIPRSIIYTGGEVAAGNEWVQVYRSVLVHVDPAHVIKRSRGSDDLYNCLPLARHLHDEQEGHNAEFEAKYGINLTEIARAYTEEWLATPDGRAWRDEHPEGA